MWVLMRKMMIVILGTRSLIMNMWVLMRRVCTWIVNKQIPFQLLHRLIKEKIRTMFQIMI